jgi:DNA-binding CsgD family transcriptional regulator
VVTVGEQQIQRCVAVRALAGPKGLPGQSTCAGRAGPPGRPVQDLRRYCGNVRGSDLAGAVRTVASGQPLPGPRAASKLMAWLAGTSGKPDPLARLTPRQRSVLKLIGEGLTNRQIGERLPTTEKTVKNYVSTLSGKLGLKQRTAAAACAARILAASTLQSTPDMTIIDRSPEPAEAI